MWTSKQHRSGSVLLSLSGTGLLLVTMGLASTARGETTALAETLYQEGRALMSKGQTKEACTKFEESQRVDPATGTLLNLAVCHQQLGQLATAWAEFRAAEAMALHDRRQDRARMAKERWTALEERLSHLTVVVTASGRIPGLEITLDGTILGQPSWNVPTPIDPGEHLVSARAPGYTPLSTTVQVGALKDRPSVIVQLAALPQPPVVASAPASSSVVPPALQPSNSAAVNLISRSPDQSNAAPVDRLRAGAYVATGVGTAALVVGSIFGARAFTRWSDRNRACAADNACTPAGAAAGDSAARAARVADIALGVGVAAMATGGFLFYRSHVRARAAAANAESWTLRLLPNISATRALAVGLDW